MISLNHSIQITWNTFLILILLPSSISISTSTHFQNILHDKTWTTVFSPKATTFHKSWLTEPLILRNGITTNVLNSIFQFSDLDPLFYSSSGISASGQFTGDKAKHPNDYKIVKLELQDNEWWSAELNQPNGLDVPEASKLIDRGFSIVLNKVDHRWKSIHRVAKEIEQVMGQRVGVNLYLSPPLSQGFDTHFDEMEVFVIQIKGKKIWRIYQDPFVRAPRLDQRFKPMSAQLKTKNHTDILLKQGDILHLPSGFVHSAHVQDLSSPSIHLSFGIEVDVAFRWEGLLHAIVRSHYTEIEIKNLNSKRLKTKLQKDINSATRMLCHATISLLSTTSVNGMFGTPVPSIVRGSIYTPVDTTTTVNILIKEKMLNFIEFFANNIENKNSLKHWYSREELVKQCWRDGRLATYYLDQNNQEVFVGEPPEKELSSLLTITNQELSSLLISLLQDETLVQNGINNMEKEYDRRGTVTNEQRNKNLHRHETQRQRLYGDVITKTEGIEEL